VQLNTGYTIHPEEILAENFRLLVTGRRDRIAFPEILDRLEAVLMRHNQDGIAP
jgi:hypothetical protein